MSNQNPSNSLKLIGKVKDAHGLKGELLVVIFSKQNTDWLHLKEMTLAQDQAMADSGLSIQSLKIEKIRETTSGLVVRAHGLNNRNQSESLKGQLVFVASDQAQSKPGERIFLREILGFEVLDHDQKIGLITGFSSNGPQDILVVNEKIEIPFVEAFIKKLDFKAQKLFMRLPEGLLDVNLPKT